MLCIFKTFSCSKKNLFMSKKQRTESNYNSKHFEILKSQKNDFGNEREVKLSKHKVFLKLTNVIDMI